MYNLMIIIHIAVCLLLIGVVLFQADEGEGLSGAFGTSAGGSSSSGSRMFGKKGTAGVMVRFTAGLVTVFMVTSLFLTFMVSNGLVDKDSFTGRYNQQMQYPANP